MALRNLVIEGDPLLRKKSRPVDEITPRIIKLLDDMADTMYYENRGVGIAAPQVGVLRRVFIVDVGDDHGKVEFINPEILETSGSQTDNEWTVTETSLPLKAKAFLPDAFFTSMTILTASFLLTNQQTERSTALKMTTTRKTDKWTGANLR